jgi:hypothetical protein
VQNGNRTVVAWLLDSPIQLVRPVFFRRPVKPDKIPSLLREEHAIIEIRVVYDAPNPSLMIA